MRHKLKDAVEDYLRSVLGLEIEFQGSSETSSFPAYLAETYEITRCNLLGHSFLALFLKADEFTPASIEKQENWLHTKTGKRGILILPEVESYVRKRLIERKIPFIVPTSQLYLPDLGIDLREFMRRRRRPVSRLTPASQVLVLAQLLQRWEMSRLPSLADLAERLGYTKMTMSRALEELQSVGLLHRLSESRTVAAEFHLRGRKLWEAARPFLRSPVQKRIYLDEWFSELGFLAGESALAEKSMLGHPHRKTWAVTKDQWKNLQRSPDVRMIPAVSKNAAHAEFEVWIYDPGLLSQGRVVDPLSLALSFGRVSDVRLEAAIDEVLRDVPW